MPTKSALAANLVCWKDVVCFLACCLPVVIIALQPIQCKASVCKSFCSIFYWFSVLKRKLDTVIEILNICLPPDTEWVVCMLRQRSPNSLLGVFHNQISHQTKSRTLDEEWTLWDFKIFRFLFPGNMTWQLMTVREIKEKKEKLIF